VSRERCPGSVGVVPASSENVICLDCDTVHREVSLSRGEVARCSCCNAVLARKHGLEVGQLLAITITAAILFVIANVTPVLSIEVGGIHTEANVWMAALSLERGWIFWAAVVLALTTFVVPLLQLVLLLWVLSFANLKRRAPGFRIALVLLHRLRPWSMTEVFLLGALVAIVKLSAWVHVVAGEGIGALSALTILLAILGRYESRAWWKFAEQPPS
jgi:paraquat-inducible protein A